MSTPPPFNVVTRARWGAEPALSKEPIKHPIPYLKYMPVPYAEQCFTEEECVKQLKVIQHHDMYDGKQQDIIPNFLIGDDGKAYEGRGWFSAPPDLNVPKHFVGQFLLIAHIGGGKPDAKPSQKFAEAKQGLIQFGVRRKFIMEQHGTI